MRSRSCDACGVLMTDDQRKPRGSALWVVKIRADYRNTSDGDYGDYDFCNTCASKLMSIVRNQEWAKTDDHSPDPNP